MTSSVRVLAGDALIALGETIRGRRVRFAGIEPADYDVNYQRHDPAAGWTAPAPLRTYTTGAAITPDVVRSALDELPDSQLIAIAATIIAGWKPILLPTSTAALTDVDVLVAALRDRAAQFRAVEHDADEPFLTRANLDAHLNGPSR